LALGDRLNVLFFFWFQTRVLLTDACQPTNKPPKGVTFGAWLGFGGRFVVRHPRGMHCAYTPWSRAFLLDGFIGKSVIWAPSGKALPTVIYVSF